MRRPSVGRLIAITFAATIVLLTCFDTAMACRFFFKNRGCNPCAQVTVCAAPAPVRCASTPAYGTMHYAPQAVSAPIANDCCGGEWTTVIGEGTVYMDGAIPSIDVELAPAPTYSETPLYSEGPIYSEGPAVQSDGAIIGGGVANDSILSDDSDDSEVPEPSDDTFPGGVPAPELAEPEDDAVGDTGFDEMPADDTTDDALDGFGDAPATDDDSGLGDSGLDDMPADDFGGLDEPADDSGFGDAPADDLPAFDETPADDAPADIPADIPADDGDDNLDDLFGSNADEPEPRVARQNDGSGEEAADDLFSEPAADTLEEVPADNVDDLDDLFGFREATQSRFAIQVSSQVDSGQVDSGQPLVSRVWTDNTGQYKTVGRLVKISSTHIRLLKDTGRFTTVSKQRLCAVDLDYVQQMTAQLGMEDFDKLARR